MGCVCKSRDRGNGLRGGRSPEARNTAEREALVRARDLNRLYLVFFHSRVRLFERLKMEEIGMK